MDVEQEIHLLKSEVRTLQLKLKVEQTVTIVLARWLQQLSKTPLERVFELKNYPFLGKSVPQEDYLFELRSRYREINKLLAMPLKDLDKDDA